MSEWQALLDVPAFGRRVRNVFAAMKRWDVLDAYHEITQDEFDAFALASSDGVIADILVNDEITIDEFERIVDYRLRRYE